MGKRTKFIHHTHVPCDQVKHEAFVPDAISKQWGRETAENEEIILKKLVSELLVDQAAKYVYITKLRTTRENKGNGQKYLGTLYIASITVGRPPLVEVNRPEIVVAPADILPTIHQS